MNVQELPATEITDYATENLRPRDSFWPGQNIPADGFLRPLPQWTRSLNEWGGIQGREQGSPTVSIRGSSQAGRTLGVWNGVPLNFSTGFGIPNLFLPKEILGATQIIKGSASQFYGSQAMGGALLLGPRYSETNEISLGLSDTDHSVLPWKKGGLGNNTLSLIVPLTQSKNVKRQISFFNEYNDGHFPFVDLTEMTSMAGRKKDQIRNNNRHRLTRAVFIGEEKWNKIKIKYSLILGQENRDLPGSTVFSGLTEQESWGTLLNLNPQFQLSKSFDIASNTSFLLLNSGFQFGSNKSFFHHSTLIQQTKARWVFNRWQFQLFADYFSHGLNSSFYDKKLGENRWELAPHIFYQWAPSWFSTLSTRFLVKENQWLQSFSINFKRSKNWLWGTFSEGFGVGSLSDRWGASPSSRANPDLQPEKSSQIELGYQFNSQNSSPTIYAWRWGFQVQAFRTHWFNFFDSQLDSMGRFQKVNSGQGLSFGGEIQLWARWGPWEFRGEYDKLITENESEDPFLFSPENQWTLSLNHFIGPFLLNLSFQAWNHFYDRNNRQELIQLSDWTQWNFTLSSHSFQKFNFSVGVENILDTPRQLSYGFPEPQRRFWFNGRYTF